MKREELECPVVDEYYGECEWERHPNKYYYKSEADSVMDAMEARIKELETALQKERDFGQHIARCADHDIEKLTSENARLKAQVPKWVSVKDRLPNILDDVIIFYGNVFYCVTYYGEDDCWGVCSNIKFSPNVVTHWMPLPPPPTTEESSATEKENG